MYIDILPNDNLEEAVMATFKEEGERQYISRVRLSINGEWQWCAATGWSEDGPVPASIVKIEESGDGPALLVFGGEEGLRFAKVADESSADPKWNLDDASQWAEGFLICRPNTQYK